MSPTDRPGAAPSTAGRACVCWPETQQASPSWMHERVDAEPAAVRELRERMRSWVEAIGLDEELAASVVLIVDEAVTNAVEHACPDWVCHVELVAGPRACGGGVAVLVADDGTWQEPGDPGFRGRGMMLMNKLSDRSTIETTDRGTTVRMCWATPHPN